MAHFRTRNPVGQDVESARTQKRKGLEYYVALLHGRLGRVRLPLQTLLYVFREAQDGRQVLLGEKIRGFGCGMITAPGGHVGPGESVIAAAVRAAEEEVGVSVSEADTDRVAVLTYRFPAGPSVDAEVRILRQTVVGHGSCVRRAEADLVPRSRAPAAADLGRRAVLACAGTERGAINRRGHLR